MRRIEFSDVLYRRSHGKAPRGVGLWAFTPDPDVTDGDDRRVIWVYGKTAHGVPFSEAKKRAAAIASRHPGIPVLWVLP